MTTTVRHQSFEHPAVDVRPDRTVFIIALTLGAVALVLSATGSWIPSLWGDEAASVLSAERSLPSLFRMLGHVDAVHGTYYLFLHFWVSVFGSSPFAVRFPSAIAVGVSVSGGRSPKTSRFTRFHL